MGDFELRNLVVEEDGGEGERLMIMVVLRLEGKN